MPLSTADKEKVIKAFAKNENDTGSAQVQVALLTENIRRLTEHLKVNRKDFASKRGLLKMVSRRKNLLKYLQRENEVLYRDIVSRLGLRR